jgi:catechol 2,3-dioxygenase-like lactoylglutathione lyase family enzyme
MTPNRVSLITLGVDYLPRSQAYYAALGWREAAVTPGSVFFQMAGMVLSLFGREALAADQGRPGAALGTGASTLAQCFPDRAAVDAAYAHALDAGATALKAPEEVFWGGYSGYVADPDGHVWEFAHNPFWTLDEDGGVTIPDS